PQAGRRWRAAPDEGPRALRCSRWQPFPRCGGKDVIVACGRDAKSAPHPPSAPSPRLRGEGKKTSPRLRGEGKDKPPACGEKEKTSRPLVGRRKRQAARLWGEEKDKPPRLRGEGKDRLARLRGEKDKPPRRARLSC